LIVDEAALGIGTQGMDAKLGCTAEHQARCVGPSAHFVKVAAVERGSDLANLGQRSNRGFVAQSELNRASCRCADCDGGMGRLP